MSPAVGKNRRKKRKSSVSPGNSQHGRGRFWKRKKQNRSSNQKYWIQECEESSPFLEEFDVTLIISRVDLTDSYRLKKATSILQPNGSNEAMNKSLPSPSLVTTGEAAVNSTITTTNKSFANDLAVLEKTIEDVEHLESLDKKNLDSKLKDEEFQCDQARAASDSETRQADTKTIKYAIETTENDNVKNSKHPKADVVKNTLNMLSPASATPSDKNATTVCVLKHSSCRGPFPTPPHRFFDLPNGDCGDGILNPYPKTEVPDKFWAQRRRLFTRFDFGIQLDREGWYSVTPEVMANHIAQRLAPSPSNAPIPTCSMTETETTTLAGSKTSDSLNGRPYVVLDAFVGVGGNAIAFARHPNVSLVIGVDSDRSRLEMAASNCLIYDIAPEKILFIHGDACLVLNKYKNGLLVIQPSGGGDDEGEEAKNETAPETLTSTTKYRIVSDMKSLPSHLNAIFLSPPWGGVDYEQAGQFDLSHITVETGTSLRRASNNNGSITSRSAPNNALMNGQEVLKLAVQALPTCGGRLAYFLPRTTNGISLAQSAYEAGLDEIELEQQYLSSKLKALAMYSKDCIQRESIEDDDEDNEVEEEQDLTDNAKGE
ncbi:hypothetical protein ACA910_006264 [Epithemia clementina (nom. ined.)]